MPSGRQQRQRQQQKALHRLSPTPGAGITLPSPTAVSGWRGRTPQGEVGPGTRSGLISPGAAVALESPSRVHHQPVTASSPATWLGRRASQLTPRRQTEHNAWPHSGLRWVLPRHACLLPASRSQLRTALRCTRAGGLQRLERETHKGYGHSDGGVGACPGGHQAWGNLPYSQAHPHPFPALTLEVHSQAGAAEREPLNAPLTPPA